MSKLSPFLTSIALLLAPHLEEARAKGLYCALSGGADSVALLLALRELGVACHALHCNFQLRGAESERDEHFVRQLCQRYEVPLEVRRFATQEEATTRGESIEMAARRLRYAWFAEKERPVAVGHHADDNVETFLLNLLRGTGLRGLTGMEVDNGQSILRPLLHSTRQEILDYLQERGEGFCNDSSNIDTHFRRNALRHQVLPLLRTLNPSIDLTLTATIDRLQAQYEVYQLGLEQLEKRFSPLRSANKSTYPLSHIRETGNLGRTYLFEQLSPLGFDAAQVEKILTARTGAIFHSPSHTACVSAQGLEIKNKQSLPSPQLQITQERRTPEFRPARSPNLATVDSDTLVGELHVRHLQNGERFRPYGLPKGSRLVNDYLADRHLSRLERQECWAVCDDIGIVWLVGHTIAHRCAVTPATQRIALLSLAPHD